MDESTSTTVEGAAPRLCVVVPCYDEAESLPLLVSALQGFLGRCPIPARVLLVDDGSRDATPELLREACRRDPRLAWLRLSRNFGHQAAISAGLAHASEDDVVALMDADLQDPPEVILEMLERWREGYQVVYGVRTGRKEPLVLRAAYALFYRLLRRLASIDIPLDAGDFCLMDRSVVTRLNALPERGRFLRGLRSWIGLRQVGVPYERRPRAAGSSKYDVKRLMNLAVEGFVGFSSVPLRLASWLGGGAALLGLVYLVYAVLSRLFLSRTPPGWASLVVVIVFFSGVQLMVLGIIGEYLGRVFEEVKGRPSFIVADGDGWVAGRRPGGPDG
jgi:glycosyltransferase involved in cell wall biosynthesis